MTFLPAIEMGIGSDGRLTFTMVNTKETIKPSRSNKGRSLLAFVDDFVVIDLETTGLDPEYDEIIEFGAIKVIDGKIDSTFSMLVKPSNIIRDYIAELTGISNDMVENSPAANEALPHFLEFVGSYVVVAHNANFDINFLYDNCNSHLQRPFANDFIDTMRLTRRIYPNLQYYKLEKTAHALDLPSSTFHRALGDCHVTLDLYNHLRSYVNENNLDVDSLLKPWSARDITATTTMFDSNHQLYGKTCVFTGTLDKMTRKEAMQTVVNIGGKCADNVTKKTNYLILGASDYSKIKDGKSSKQKKAEQFKLSGLDIEIISENVFYDMIDDSQ